MQELVSPNGCQRWNLLSAVRRQGRGKGETFGFMKVCPINPFPALVTDYNRMQLGLRWIKLP
ncbi:MAG TPA: hypothetical protein DDZ80_15880 [Cyanobacteria bacterium UBA8803]|nr:hypothetical protein [Cyanobacteria bacterium UBA9273]HBL59895.1 hypothetical protein [Cyanobacteria bacterium UBA8803]